MGRRPGHGDADPAVDPTDVPYLAKVADDQLGRMVAKLQALGQLDDTLIVLTADHGVTHGAEFYGNTGPVDQGNFNWYYGDSVNDGPFLQPSPPVAALQTALGGNIPVAKKQEAAKALRSAPGVIATYWRDGDRYVLDSKRTDRKMTRAERRWFKKNARAIVNSMAADNGPDAVGPFGDNVTWSVYGDHGGHSEEAQRVPLVFWSAGMADESSSTPFPHRRHPAEDPAHDGDLQDACDGRARPQARHRRRLIRPEATPGAAMAAPGGAPVDGAPRAGAASRGERSRQSGRSR